jgi:ferric-dicitrate binding protein FerR (iron transport regulator)
VAGENMMDHTIWISLGRYLAGEVTADEKRALEDWLKNHPEEQRLLEILRASRDESASSDIDRMWLNTGLAQDQSSPANHVTGNKRFHIQPRVYRFLRYAALILVGLLLPYFYISGFDLPQWLKPGREMIILNVADGDRQKILLEDGTRILLDAGSLLSYPAEFEAGQRIVSLEGQGFFEVASQADRPFQVQTNEAVIRVVGTKFSVAAWNEIGETRVTVSEGIVSFNSANGSESASVQVKAGYTSFLMDDSSPATPRRTDLQKHLGWMNNTLMVENMPLENILFRMERWYDLEFFVSDSTLLQEHLSLHLDQAEFSDIMELICSLTGARYSQRGDTIHLQIY